MAREYAKINVGIWADDDFLDFDINAQLLYFVLLTDPSLSYCGVSDWRPKRIQARTAGWSAEMFANALAKLTDQRLIIVDEVTEEYLVRGFLRHDGVLNHNRTRVSALKAAAAVASKTIRGVVVHELNRLRDENPDSTLWEMKIAQDVLKRRSIDPFGPGFGNDLTHDLGTIRAGVRDEFGPNLDNDLALLSLTKTITISSNEDISLDHSIEEPEPTTVLAKTLEAEFEETFWPAYPRKKAKANALKAFIKARKTTSLETILDGARRYAAQPFEDDRFIAHAATWLNGKRWEDEITHNVLSTRPNTSRETNARSTYDAIGAMDWPFGDPS